MYFLDNPLQKSVAPFLRKWNLCTFKFASESHSEPRVSRWSGNSRVSMCMVLPVLTVGKLAWSHMVAFLIELTVQKSLCPSLFFSSCP